MFGFHLHPHGRDDPKAGVQVELGPFGTDQLVGAHENQREQLQGQDGFACPRSRRIRRLRGANPPVPRAYRRLVAFFGAVSGLRVDPWKCRAGGLPVTRISPISIASQLGEIIGTPLQSLIFTNRALFPLPFLSTF